MPYIKKLQRPEIDKLVIPLIEHLKSLPLEDQDGSLNYAVTKVVKHVYPQKYFHYNRLFLMLQITPIVTLMALYVLVDMSLTTRRLHDLGRATSGNVFPFIPWGQDFYFYFKTGDKGPNKYGMPQAGISLRILLGFY